MFIKKPGEKKMISQKFEMKLKDRNTEDLLKIISIVDEELNFRADEEMRNDPAFRHMLSRKV